MSRPAHTAPSPHRFTREEYHRVGEAGLFAHERVELLNGTIVTMSPPGCAHAGTLDQLDGLLREATAGLYRVRVQLPIVLDDWSEPEPDLAVCRVDAHHYTRSHPTPEPVLLVCEVSSSSLGYDRFEKAAAYAASGIVEYWIVDVENRVVSVLADPDPVARRYRREDERKDGDTIMAPGGGTLAVTAILPPL